MLHLECVLNRFAEKHIVNGVEHRTLTKIYGLRFILSVRGEGRKFDPVHLFVAIGMSSLSKTYRIDSFLIKVPVLVI